MAITSGDTQQRRVPSAAHCNPDASALITARSVAGSYLPRKLRICAVRQGDGQSLGMMNHVIVGENIPVGRNDHP